MEINMPYLNMPMITGFFIGLTAGLIIHLMIELIKWWIERTKT